MKEETLFEAIGAVEDRYLEELEASPVQRLPKHFGLVAALIALLLTACAAPVVIRSFDKVISGSRSETGFGYLVRTYENGALTETHFLPSGLDLEVEVSPDAPETIMEHYLPLAFLEHSQIESYSDTDQEFSLSLSMKIPRYGRVYGITYFQRILPKDGLVYLEDVMDDDEWRQTMRTFGDTKVMEISGHDAYTDAEGNTICYRGNWIAHITTKQLYWSDGHYLFGLRYPVTYPLSDADTESIINSLTAVEDLSQYLPVP